MTVYFDSSALVAVYVTEACSGRARREIRKHASVPWTPLHELEVRNALRLLHGRGQIEEDELIALLGHIDEDLDGGRLARPGEDLGAVFRRAVELSERWATTTLARTLDILHVGAMQELGCTTLVSGDGRQLAFAASAGLATIDTRRQVRGAAAISDS
jgi:predicted nucleic acid-binding protein